MSYTIVRTGSMLAAAALALTMWTTASFAYSADQQRLCSGDAMRLCGQYVPDVDRITACMTERYSQLSDGCKSVFDAPAAAQPAPVSYAPATKPAKPLNIKPNLKKG
jgi:hypothetical protein